MEDKKEKMHPFFKLLIILFFIFFAFYIALVSGYYPSRVQKKALVTNEKLQAFENDLNKDDNVIRKTGYIEEDINYSNFVTKTGSALTNTLGKIIDKTSKGIKDVFKLLFW